MRVRESEKDATATLGLGEDQVIPIDGYSWRLANNEVAVMSGVNAATSDVALGATQGTNTRPPSSRRRS